MTKVSSHDAYIEAAASFAQPILNHLRELVHKACPEVNETIKWGFPHFEYKGVMCSMAAFKTHCAFGFWKGSIMSDPVKIINLVGKTAMGNFERITKLSDLPTDKILIAYLKEAKRLNDDSINLPARKGKDEKKLTVPSYFLKAIKGNAEAYDVFKNFSYSNKKEYVDWVEDAKTDVTRQKRIQTAIEWMAEGKIRNWKYVKK